MALDTPTLQIVSTAIYGDTNAGRNLTQCFIDATGTFSPAYVGVKDRLSNFTNYVHTSLLTSFTGSVKSKSSSVCNQALSPTYYHDGGNATPGIGDKVYSDNLSTFPLIAGYYGSSAGYFQITGSIGEVSTIGICLF